MRSKSDSEKLKFTPMTQDFISFSYCSSPAMASGNFSANNSIKLEETNSSITTVIMNRDYASNNARSQPNAFEHFYVSRTSTRRSWLNCYTICHVKLCGMRLEPYGFLNR